MKYKKRQQATALQHDGHKMALQHDGDSYVRNFMPLPSECLQCLRADEIRIAYSQATLLSSDGKSFVVPETALW